MAALIIASLLRLSWQLTQGERNAIEEEILVARADLVTQFSNSTLTDPRLRICSAADGSINICVKLTAFQTEVEGCHVQCKAFAPGRSAPPRYVEFLDSVSKPCKNHSYRFYLKQPGLQADTDYDVFCAIWQTLSPSSSLPLFRIVPSCEFGASACGLRAKTGMGFNMHERLGVAELIGVVLILAYVGWSFQFNSNTCKIHQTGVTVVVGLCCGTFLQKCYGLEIEYNYNKFSYLAIPLIMFAAGYNLRKQRKFFYHWSHIFVLGIAGTVISFASIYYSSVLFANRFVVYDGKGNPVPLQEKSRLLLVMASALSSSDSVMPIAFMSGYSYPRLYSVIFGEDVLNDLVSILLSESAAGSSNSSWWELIGSIAYYFSTSLIMGIVFGLSISMLFKCSFSRCLEKNACSCCLDKTAVASAVKPVAVLLILHCACFVVSEISGVSSVLTLFFSGFVCNHFASQHLSEEAQCFASTVTELCSYMSRAFVIGYSGLAAIVHLKDGSKFSYGLICFYSAIVFVTRIFVVLISAICLRCARNRSGRAAVSNISQVGTAESNAVGPPSHQSKKPFTLSEWCVVAFAGCTRGTIAYALILKSMPSKECQSPLEEILVSSVIGAVLINYFVFGGLFPLILRMLVEPDTGTIPNLKNDSHKLIKNKVISDVTFVLQGRKVYASRAHLAARSKFFEHLLYVVLPHEKEQRTTTATEEEEATHVVVSDIGYDDFLKILEYMYTGFVRLDESTVHSLLNVAYRYQLEGLQFLCQLTDPWAKVADAADSDDEGGIEFPEWLRDVF